MFYKSNRTRRVWLERFLHDRHGSTAVMLAIVLPLMIAGLAFGSEYGYFELAKRRLQNAADTAAYAAGTQLRSGLDEAEMAAAALMVAEESGFYDGTGTLALASPPVAGAFAGDNSAVHVTLNQPVSRRFSKLFVRSALALSVDATVQVNNGRPACILSLNPSADDAVNVSGSTTVTLSGCDVAANSISSSAVSSNGGAANLEADCISTVGEVDDPGGVFTYNNCPGPIENAPVTADPYDDVAEPVCLGTYKSPNTFGNGGNPATESEGCWDGPPSNLNISKTVNLNPGAYIFRDVDIKLSGNGQLVGTDVTVFLEGSSSITVTGNATIDIKAPTKGPTAGLALFGARGDEIDMNLSGNTGVSIVGAIYSPNSNSDITYIGNTAGFGAGECTQVIGGGQVTFSGNSEFDTDCSNSGTRDIMAAQSILIVE